jgi:mono/diheme cytochrome c family protein
MSCLDRFCGFALALAAFGLATGSGACLADTGEEVFAKICANCHGKDGKAQTPIARKLGVKDLTQSKLTDAEIEKQIVDGKRDEHGKEKMPAFKGKLSDADIKALVPVVKGLRK